MEFIFDRPDDPAQERYEIALLLDRKKLKERILIGIRAKIQRRLQGVKDAAVFLDVERELGTLLTEFTQDKEKAWNQYGTMPLWDALHTHRFAQPALEKTARDFLEAKYRYGTPMEKYAAIRIWDGYRRARIPKDRSDAAEKYMRDISGLKTLFLYTKKPEILMKSRNRLVESHSFEAEEFDLDIWYPLGRFDFECAMGYHSLVPLVLYYQKRIAEWQLCFQKCSVCGKYFLAPSQRYSICSEACRKIQAKKSKQEFDDRARSNQYDMIYKNVCQRWRNRINKAKRIGLAEERMAELNKAFTEFKQSALEQKKKVGSKKLTLMEFQDWLDAQDEILNSFLD